MSIRKLLTVKANKFIAGALAVLGFGGVVGLATGCGATRASKSRATQVPAVADTVGVRDGDAPVMAMYGVPPVRFDPVRPVGE